MEQAYGKQCCWTTALQKVNTIIHNESIFICKWIQVADVEHFENFQQRTQALSKQNLKKWWNFFEWSKMTQSSKNGRKYIFVWFAHDNSWMGYHAELKFKWAPSITKCTFEHKDKPNFIRFLKISDRISFPTNGKTFKKRTVCYAIRLISNWAVNRFSIHLN